MVAGVLNSTSVISAVHWGFGQASAPEGSGGAAVVSVGNRKLPFGRERAEGPLDHRPSIRATGSGIGGEGLADPGCTPTKRRSRSGVEACPQSSPVRRRPVPIQPLPSYSPTSLHLVASCERRLLGPAGGSSPAGPAIRCSEAFYFVRRHSHLDERPPRQLFAGRNGGRPTPPNAAVMPGVRTGPPWRELGGLGADPPPSSWRGRSHPKAAALEAPSRSATSGPYPTPTVSPSSASRV
jgi:hypothetical protein